VCAVCSSGWRVMNALSFANGGADLFQLDGASGLVKVRLQQRATIGSLGAGTWFIASRQMPRRLRCILAAWQTAATAGSSPGWVIGYATRVRSTWRLDETRWSDSVVLQSFRECACSSLALPSHLLWA
jgi:hypothetical protein